jgi:hypothetical protein
MTALIKRPDRPNLRAAIFRLEDYLLDQEQVEIEIVNRFAPGVYTREMIVPEGTMLTGMIHKTEHISIFLEGKMLVTDGDGQGMEITAPIVEIAKPGVKRVGIALERVRWITVHPTDETDIDTLEDMLVTNDFSEVEHLVDQQDYASIGISDELIEACMQIEVHSKPIDGLEIAPSKRHGLGVFARDFIASGAIIAPAIIEGRLLEYSRYANHSADPNAEMVGLDGNVSIRALRDIEDEEVTVDYRKNLLLGAST